MYKDLPEGYDPSKLPTAGYRLRGSVKGTADALSGYAYVPVVLKGEHTAGKILIKSFRRCDHVETICDSTHREHGLTCAESWQIDHSILWHRTDGGRRLLARLGLSADKYHNPDHPANKPTGPVKED